MGWYVYSSLKPSSPVTIQGWRAHEPRVQFTNPYKEFQDTALTQRVLGKERVAPTALAPATELVTLSAFERVIKCRADKKLSRFATAKARFHRSHENGTPRRVSSKNP